MRSFVKPHLVKLGLIAFTALATAQAVHAQDAPPSPEEALQKAVDTRQALFKVIDFNWQPVAQMMRKKAPFDAAAVQKTAARVEALAPMIPDVFAVDTRKATNVKTRAREGIWSNAADFKVRADDLAKAMQALGAAAKTGDQAATMKAAQGVGKACSGCHDNYKDK
ncbi:MAG: cytochrome c [Gammaproteobacteria bacterium]